MGDKSLCLLCSRSALHAAVVTWFHRPGQNFPSFPDHRFGMQLYEYIKSKSQLVCHFPFKDVCKTLALHLSDTSFMFFLQLMYLL